jgi:hypothetical protein
VVQLFPPLLEYLEKDNEESKKVSEDMNQFVKSVENVKEQVINRDTINNNIDGSEQNDSGREERLLRLVQIQIWIRIMVWNFNREEGWSLFRRGMGGKHV